MKTTVILAFAVLVLAACHKESSNKPSKFKQQIEGKWICGPMQEWNDQNQQYQEIGTYFQTIEISDSATVTCIDGDHSTYSLKYRNSSDFGLTQNYHVVQFITGNFGQVVYTWVVQFYVVDGMQKSQWNNYDDPTADWMHNYRMILTKQ